MMLWEDLKSELKDARDERDKSWAHFCYCRDRVAQCDQRLREHCSPAHDDISEEASRG